MDNSRELTDRLNLVVALPSEARPIIRLFNLKPRESAPFGLYSDVDEKVWLIVSGVGKTKSAVATDYLASVRNGGNNALWLNIGIAGHSHLAVGTCAVAHTVVDAVTGITNELSFPCQPPIRAVVVKTVAETVHDYPDDSVVDMEAAAFYSAALHYCPPEQIQIIKVISDNRHNPASGISRDFVSRIMAAALPKIDQTIREFFQSSEAKDLVPSR